LTRQLAEQRGALERQRQEQAQLALTGALLRQGQLESRKSSWSPDPSVDESAVLEGYHYNISPDHSASGADAGDYRERYREVIEALDRSTRSAADRTEELDRIQRLTRQLVEERLARKRQQLEQDRLALEKAWLRQKELEAQRLRRQRNDSGNEYGAANGGGFSGYSSYRAPGRREGVDRKRYSHGAKNRGASFGFAAGGNRAAALPRASGGNGRGLARSRGERRRYGDRHWHGDGYRSTSNRRVNRNRVARSPRAMRSRGVAPRRNVARGFGSGLSPRAGRRR
jgi:hypothetical protein